jgi:hypothetical protein
MPALQTARQFRLIGSFYLALPDPVIRETHFSSSGLREVMDEKGPGSEVAPRRGRRSSTGLERLDQASPVGTMAPVSTIKITLLSGARVQCNTPFGTVKP